LSAAFYFNYQFEYGLRVNMISVARALTVQNSQLKTRRWATREGPARKTWKTTTFVKGKIEKKRKGKRCCFGVRVKQIKLHKKFPSGLTGEGDRVATLTILKTFFGWGTHCKFLNFGSQIENG